MPKCPLRDRRQNPKCSQHSELRPWKLFAGQLQRSNLEKLVADASGEELCGINDLVLGGNCCPAPSAIASLWMASCFARKWSRNLVIATPFGSTGYFQSITRGNFRTASAWLNNAMDGSGFSILSSFVRLKCRY